MPIGKNAIKRVSNGGYSNVQSSAPDMENSVIAEKKAEEAPKAKTKEAAVEKAPVKETARKTTKRTTKKTVKAPQNQEAEYVNIGKDLPYYLL